MMAVLDFCRVSGSRKISLVPLTRHKTRTARGPGVRSLRSQNPWLSSDAAPRQELFSNLRLAINRLGTLPFAPHAPETSPVYAPPRHRMRSPQGTDRSPRRLGRSDRSDRDLHARPERDLYADLRTARKSRSARKAGEHDP